LREKPGMNSSGSLSARTAWSATGSIVNALGATVASVIVVRRLGPNLAGEYAFVCWAASFIWILASFGLPTTMSRYIAEASGRGDKNGAEGITSWVARRLLISLLIGALLVVPVVYWIAPKGAHTYNIMALFVALGMASVANSYLLGVQSFREIAKASLCSSVVLVAVQPLLTLFLSVDGALIGLLLANATAIIWLTPVVKSGVKTTNSVVPSSLVAFAAYTWLAAIMSAIVWARAELFFLTIFSSSEQVAFFSVGLLVASVVTLGVSLLTGAVMPHFSAIVGLGDQARLQADYARLTRVVALLAFPVSIGGAAIMAPTIDLVFGSKFSGAASTASVLMLGNVLSVAGVGSSLLYARGATGFIFKSGAVGTLLFVTACYIVTPQFGAFGTAWVRLAVQILMTGAGIVFIQLGLKIVPPYAAVGKIAASAIGCGVVASLIVRSGMPFSLAAAVIVGALAYIFLVRLVDPLPPRDAEALLAIFSRAPGVFGKGASHLLRWSFRI
jgi:O-antigen/teichoic acid export membrane protein